MDKSVKKGFSYIFSIFVSFSIAAISLALSSCGNAEGVSVGNDVKLVRTSDHSHIEINGKPFCILGGELGNSSASCNEDIDRIFPQLKKMGLNTVLVPAYWDLMEPVEGQFDFSLIDKGIRKADECGLHLVYLWFGAWKNSMSCYTPEWFKKDVNRFPRAMTKEGKKLEIASAFSEEVFNADSRAFAAFMNHIKNTDISGRVIMIQIENEIGMLESARDFSPEANAAWNAQNIESDPDDIYAQERFMARCYARYVEKMAKVARSIIPDMPLYVNAAMNSRGRLPGQYPSAGPLAHLMNEWKSEAPSVDIMSPDIYDSGFEGWIAGYAKENNPLFVPEMKRCDANGAQAMYAFGEYRAVGVSPFSIENGRTDENAPLKGAYGIMEQLCPFLYNDSYKSTGFLFSQENKERLLSHGDIDIVARHFFTLPWDPRATDGSQWPEAGAILLQIAPMEYILAGSGVVVSFKHHEESASQEKLGEDGFAEKGNGSLSQEAVKPVLGKRVGIVSCDEVSIDNGKMVYLRRLNGDEDHQGRHVRIGVDDWKILHVKLYEY